MRKRSKALILIFDYEKLVADDNWTFADGGLEV